MANEEPGDTYTPPEGFPTAHALKLRKEQATGILSVRRVGVQPDPGMMLLKALMKLVRTRLDVTDAEFDYFFELIAVEGLEEVVEQTTAKKIIHLPGRDA
jgi:hypothetical protein